MNSGFEFVDGSSRPDESPVVTALATALKHARRGKLNAACEQASDAIRHVVESDPDKFYLPNYIRRMENRW